MASDVPLILSRREADGKRRHLVLCKEVMAEKNSKFAKKKRSRVSKGEKAVSEKAVSSLRRVASRADEREDESNDSGEIHNRAGRSGAGSRPRHERSRSRGRTDDNESRRERLVHKRPTVQSDEEDHDNHARSIQKHQRRVYETEEYDSLQEESILPRVRRENREERSRQKGMCMFTVQYKI